MDVDGRLPANEIANFSKGEGKIGKFRRSWALMRCSIRVILEKLSLFPIILFLLMAVMAVFFLGPVALWPTGHRLTDGAHWQAGALD